MKYLDLRKAKYLLLVVILWVAGCGGESAGSGSPSSGGGSDSVSQSGSTAAMLTYEDVLHMLFPDRLKVFDISSDTETTFLREVGLTNIAETLFIYDGYLYIGGGAGVEIWEIGDPLYPVNVSTYRHVRGCDPVVVSSGVGYVTLRNRAGCGGDANRLEVVDFSDPLRPQLLTTYNMDFPYGLAKTNSYLAVCQESYGLSLLDVAVTEQDGVKTAGVSEVVRFFDVHCFDVIATEQSLIATATDGIYQFEIEGTSIATLSKIPVGTDNSSTRRQ